MSVLATADLPLEIFSGYVPEIAPSDLPAGASPDCSDVVFPLGSWKTRPGLGNGVFAALAGNPTVNYLRTYIDQSQNKRFLFLDGSGSMNQEFPQGTVTLGINGIPIPAGSFAKSTTAYGKEYIAISDGQFGVSDPAQWDGTFYDRLSQVGPGQAPTAADSAAGGNIPAGVHKISVFFITRSGYWTKPAPFGMWTANGGHKVDVSNIPIGPPNVVARVLVFTEAGGSTFFFTTNASNTLANGNMVIADNTTTAVTVDFSDTILASGSNAQYLFGLLELEDCAGVVSYATRLFTWGGRNLVPNFLNLSFDGGFGAAGLSPTPATAGPKNQSALANDPNGGQFGTANWTNLGGNPVVNMAGFPSNESVFLKATGYGFAIPANATITGIKVVVTAQCAPNLNATIGVKLYKAGVLVGSVESSTDLTTAPTAYPFGSSIDLWNTTWSPDDINNLNFGAGVIADATSVPPFTSVTITVPIQITVSYTTPAIGVAVGPLGWNVGAPTYVGGASALGLALPAAFGDAFAITGDGVTAVRGLITQSAALDSLSNQILLPNVSYSVRVKLRLANGLTNGTFHINLQSTSGGFTTSGLGVNAAQLTSKYQIFTAVLTSALGMIPSDLLLQVYADGTPNNGGTFLVDDIQIYPTNKPFLTSTIRASYAGQPESFDEETGVCQPYFQDGGTIRTMFVLREKLYALKDGAWFVTKDDGANEPSAWTWTPVSLAVGAAGVNAADLGEDWGIVANRAGPYIFWGGEPVKIGQEISEDNSDQGKPSWSSINWLFGYTIWVMNDRVRKRCLIGAPINGATSPNCIFYFDYVGLDTAQEVADHWSVKYSAYTGKILAIGNAPKWAPWSISANSAAFIERASDGTAHPFLGNGSATPYKAQLNGPNNTGKIYDLSDDNTSDDGAGIPWSYSTYYAPGHTDEQALQIKSHRKLFMYLSGFVKGAGAMSISAQPMGNITPDAYQEFDLVDPDASNAITAIQRVNGLVTVTCGGGHGLTDGVDNQALIKGAPDASFNGTVPITQILNPTQFTYYQYGLPDLILAGSGTVQRVSREFEYTVNSLAERVSWTFANSGNAPDSWCQMEKIVWSVVPDPWSPIRGSTY